MAQTTIMKPRKIYKHIYFSYCDQKFYFAGKIRAKSDERFFITTYTLYKITQADHVGGYDYQLLEAIINQYKMELNSVNREIRKRPLFSYDHLLMTKKLYQQRISIAKKQLKEILHSPEYLWHRLQT